ncbi:MAG: VanZ family protein [Lachnospiraceae bacterium]|nr:VanZ family protein [Lachnospiraceae bacterium]
MTKKIRSHRAILTGSNRLIAKFALLIIYLALLSYGLFFAESFGRTIEHGSYNIQPFREIGRYIEYADMFSWQIVAVNLLGNILVFLPFGFLIPSLLPANDKKHPLAITGLSLLFSAVVEVLQYLTAVGAADVDDVILNTIGGFLGYLCYVSWRILRYGKVNFTKEEQA